jgi:hypothetical protein
MTRLDDPAHALAWPMRGAARRPDGQVLCRHVPRPALDAAVAGSAKRPLGDSWAWARRGISVDICPLVAASLARWGHATRAHLHNRELSVYF